MAISMSFTEEVVMSSPRRGRYLRWKRNNFIFPFQAVTPEIGRPGLITLANIYQYKVKLNVRRLTDWQEFAGAAARVAANVRHGRSCEAQRFVCRTVQCPWRRGTCGQGFICLRGVRKSARSNRASVHSLQTEDGLRFAPATPLS